MRDHKALIYPAIFAAVLAPVFIVALITYRPAANNPACDGAALPVGLAPHSHGTGLTRVVQGGMQLIFNVAPATPLYQLVDGNLELCGDVSDADLKHITVDVNDASLALGERLPVSVTLAIRQAGSGALIVEASAPAMYAPGHGYHFGDNFRVPGGAAYEWTVTVSPVQALRQEGAQDVWRAPVTWQGSFTLAADGSVIGQAPPVQPIGELTQDGLHIMLGTQPAQPLYAVDGEGNTTPLPIAPGSRYFVVDVTDHAINYEEKLPGADVTVTFRRGATVLAVPFEPVIAPDYGFHYGANVALEPGDWQITVEVAGLDFLRHAGAAVSLARGAVSGTFAYTVTG